MKRKFNTPDVASHLAVTASSALSAVHSSLLGKAEGRNATVHSMLLLGLSHRTDCQHRNMAASATGKTNNRDNASADSLKCHEEPVSQYREIIKPTIMELTKEVRTNILCTVEGCGKILPNTPALNMHLVKSHRVKVTLTTLWFKGLCVTVMLT